MLATVTYHINIAPVRKQHRCQIIVKTSTKDLAIKTNDKQRKEREKKKGGGGGGGNRFLFNSMTVQIQNVSHNQKSIYIYYIPIY